MKVSDKHSFGNRCNHANLITALLTLCTLCSQAHASDFNDLLQIIEPQTKSQLWINAGMISHHFQQDKNFNNGNCVVVLSIDSILSLQ